MEKGLRFGVLGPLQVDINGKSVPLGTPKQRAVLAMLVMNRNRPVSIDSLIAGAWELEPPAGARATLHTYVSNLRRLLSGPDPGSRTVLVSAPPGYRLNVADEDCDIGRFTKEKGAGVQAAAVGRFEQASVHLSAALAEWRGPVLEDLRDFSCIDAFATALAEEKIVAHTARVEAEIACRRGHSVISELEALTAEHPYREPLWMQLITAYYVAGRQSDALDAYHRLKGKLADDLGVDPGQDIRRLYQRVLRHEVLDVRQAAQDTAADSIAGLRSWTAGGASSTQACLRATSGRCYQLKGTVNRIGRLSTNDVVLDSEKVSRHHAVIVQTGHSFVIVDLQSANGIEVQEKRIRGSATLTPGDHLRICDYRFTFEVSSSELHDQA